MRKRLAILIGAALVAVAMLAMGGNLRPAHALTVVPQGFTQTYVVSPPYLDTRAFEDPHDMVFAPMDGFSWPNRAASCVY